MDLEKPRSGATRPVVHSSVRRVVEFQTLFGDAEGGLGVTP